MFSKDLSSEWLGPNIDLPYQSDWLSAVTGPVQISLTRLAILSVIVTVASKSEHSIVLPTSDDGLKSQSPGRAIIPSSTPSILSHASTEAFVNASKTQRGGEVSVYGISLVAINRNSMIV